MWLKHEGVSPNTGRDANKFVNQFFKKGGLEELSR
jgi:hypothetical protein